MSPSNKKLARVFETAPKLVAATVALMEELARVLMQEIEVVTKRRISEHAELLRYKQKLAMNYRANMKALSEQGDMLAKLPAEAKTALREVAKTLARAAADNARMLSASIGATQQLIQNIMAMIKNECLPKQTYGNPAKAHLQLGIYSPTCKPVAVNRSV